MLPPGYPWVPSKKFSPFGPAVWPAKGNIQTNVLFYYIDIWLFHCYQKVSIYHLIFLKRIFPKTSIKQKLEISALQF